eukprot:Selendium_serpulae@DN6216_c2_g1_i10.p1
MWLSVVNLLGDKSKYLSIHWLSDKFKWKTRRKMSKARGAKVMIEHHRVEIIEKMSKARGAKVMIEHHRVEIIEKMSKARGATEMGEHNNNNNNVMENMINDILPVVGGQWLVVGGWSGNNEVLPCGWWTVVGGGNRTGCGGVVE